MASIGNVLLLSLLSATCGQDTNATAVKEQFLEARFLQEPNTSRPCDDASGPGDRRSVTGAVDRCKQCWDSGSELSYDDVSNYTTCVHLQAQPVAAAEVVKTHFRKARFLQELHATALCDDDNGPGDHRNVRCAVDRCKSCWGAGAELSYDRRRKYTTCVYHPPKSGQFALYCGESFRDTTGRNASIEKCQCCYPGGRLVYDRSAADSIGYTYCTRR